ncbi:MAG: hypothetical protein LBQ39_10835 [Tannerellaceae bacterium]|jgi:hypothetical protein|nr:hypothetical protein [Tannerellaceae bacterium]
MKQKIIALPSLPKNWNGLSVSQWRILKDMDGKYVSEEAYLAKVFLTFCGLVPLLYAERWRSFLAAIPLMGRFVRMTGRQVIGSETGVLQWQQVYRFKGWRNKLWGVRFWMEDEEVVCFKDGLKFLLTEKSVGRNPIESIRWKGETYHSPETYLSNMKWLTYNTCNMCLTAYRKTKKKEHLYLFITVLYGMDKKAASAIPRLLDPFQISLIELFWDGCQQYFAKSFKHLFSKSKDETNPNSDYLKEEAEITVFVGKQSFQSPDLVREMKTFDALEYLEQNAILIDAKKRELNKIKRK